MVYQPLVDASKRGASVETIRSLLQETPFARGRELMETVRDAMKWQPFTTEKCAPAHALKALIMHDPTCVRFRDYDGLLLHHACRYDAPFNVIQLLVELYPGAVREFNNRFRMVPLHYACRRATLPTVELLATMYPEAVGMQDRHLGDYPLHDACSARDISYPTVQFLLQKYPEGVRTLNFQGELPLHHACSAQKGRIPRAIHLLVELHPEGVATVSKAGLLPLHRAAFESSPELVRLLLELNETGAFSPTTDGTLPLHFACLDNNLEKVKLLTEIHPDGVRWLDCDGDLPIHYACQSENPSVDVLQLLIDLYPESIHVANKKGRTPLQVACKFHDDNGFDLIRLLVEADRFSLVRETKMEETPLKLVYAPPRRLNGMIIYFLIEQHNIIVESLREAYELVVCEPFDLPELVEAKIWGYTGIESIVESDWEADTETEPDSDGGDDLESVSDGDEVMYSDSVEDEDMLESDSSWDEHMDMGSDEESD